MSSLWMLGLTSMQRALNAKPLSAAAEVGQTRPFPWGYPPFLFFSTQVATRGVLEMRQIPQFPF